jgi:hypothetical protein
MGTPVGIRRSSRGHAARNRVTIIVGIAAALALFVAFSASTRTAVPKEPEVSAAETPAAAVVAAAGPAPTLAVQAPSPVATAEPVGDEPPPVIDQILVEKKEVCEGEENLITIRAHTQNGTDEFLHYVIDGRQGQSQPVRLYTDNGHVVGNHFIRVFGRNNAALTLPLPSYTVKDCRPTYLGEIETRLEPNSWADYDFTVHVFPFPNHESRHRQPRPFVPTRVEWSFGDGETATSNGPTTSHSYEGRSQDAEYSYMAITANVWSQYGDKLTARSTLALSNSAFEALKQKNIVQLLVSLNPRFPEVDGQGRVVQHVRLWHTSKEAVTIDTAIRMKYFDGGKGQSAAETVDVGALLGTSSIPPGRQGIETTVVLDPIAEPGVFSMTYVLSGRSSSDQQVMGSFSVMRPPPLPTAENSKIVSDSMFKAKILATREILGKSVVSDEDIARLDREGRFANLPPVAGDAPTMEPTVPPGATHPIPTVTTQQPTTTTTGQPTATRAQSEHQGPGGPANAPPAESK